MGLGKRAGGVIIAQVQECVNSFRCSLCGDVALEYRVLACPPDKTTVWVFSELPTPSKPFSII